jgi:hypothetical protein
VPTPSDPRRRRALLLGWSVAGCASLIAFWIALSLPLPQEHVRTSRLAAVPEPARSAELRVSPSAGPSEPHAEPLAATNSGSHTSEPAERLELATEPARAPQRIARNLDARGPGPQRAAEPQPREEPRLAERSSRVDVDAHVALGDGHALVEEPTRAVLEPEPVPASARAGDEAQPQTAVPSDATARPGPGLRAPAPAIIAPQRASVVPGTALRPRVADLAVRGSLPSSQVAQGVERVAPQLNECYRKAAAATAQPLPRRVQITLELDEQGRARNPSVRGAPAGLAACVSAAVARVASRRAPDTGRVAATFALELAP